jgi:hypothetical protein
MRMVQLIRVKICRNNQKVFQSSTRYHKLGRFPEAFAPKNLPSLVLSYWRRSISFMIT